MGREGLRNATQHEIVLGGRRVSYRVARSKSAQKIRVRVSPTGMEVIQPSGRGDDEVLKFLAEHERWIIDQLDRGRTLRGIYRAPARPAALIHFRGNPTRLRVELTDSRAAGNSVQFRDGEIVVSRGPHSRTTAARSLELWLRREARREIERHVRDFTSRIRRQPNRIYVMGQRTKWGNCSARGNLSFNWRLVLAPDYVLRYLVSHEVVHLAVPDHSAKFWLMVQSVCPDTEKAKQWLSRHELELQVSLLEALSASAAARAPAESGSAVGAAARVS